MKFTWLEVTFCFNDLLSLLLCFQDQVLSKHEFPPAEAAVHCTPSAATASGETALPATTLGTVCPQNQGALQPQCSWTLQPQGSRALPAQGAWAQPA